MAGGLAPPLAVTVGADGSAAASPVPPLADLAAALRLLPPPPPAALLHLQIGAPWPPYLRFILRAAAATPQVAFYFLGPPLDTAACGHCHRLPLDPEALLARLETHLQLPRGRVRLSGRKLCDLKPLWPALFPELSARHAWIGYSDYDILYGDLAAELAGLTSSDELLVPLAYFPQPIANGNMLLMRNSTKMIRAFERSDFWRQAVTFDGYWVFDEWWGTRGPSMMDVYYEMLLQGELNARPTRMAIAQDTVVLNEGGRGIFITIDQHAAVRAEWRGGRLFGVRTGPCLCPNDTAFTPIAALSSTVLSGCTACLRRQGAVLAEQQVTRHTELLGLHFQTWKKRWNDQPALHDRGRLKQDSHLNCPNFTLFPTGFQCD
ncbi:hypothetical protein AB1Y20_006317 [Prymnesium parvum]|uniref:Hexosyltransferase n=1 Tax=Prymnesium parvum TaxID=97485 RepID=A0AB34IXF9_PRYPA